MNRCGTRARWAPTGKMPDGKSEWPYNGHMPVSTLICVAILSRSPSVGPDQAVRLPNGDRVRILQVCDDRRHVAWTPLGKTVPYQQPEIVAEMSEALGGKNEVQPNPDNTLSIVAQIARPRANDGPSVAFRLDNSREVLASSWTYYDTIPEHNPTNWTAGVAKPFQLVTTHISVGVAEGRWTVVGTDLYRDGNLHHVRGQKFATSIKVVPGNKGSRDFDLTVDVSLPPSVSSSAFQVMAYDRKGHAMSSAGSVSASHSRLPTTYWFRGSIKNLARVTLETRHYDWASFRDVRLKANP